MKVICISGKARHGKDTTAGYLKGFFEEKDRKVLIAHYGDLVKYICKTFFDWDGNKDEAGRTLLQYIGTDVIREQEPDYWVGFIESVLSFFSHKWDYVLIPDCRFPNEIEYLKDMGHDVIHIRVVRNSPGFVSPLTEEQQKHISETALDGYPVDYYVGNFNDLDDLRGTVRIIGQKLMEDNLYKWNSISLDDLKKATERNNYASESFMAVRDAAIEAAKSFDDECSKPMEEFV